MTVNDPSDANPPPTIGICLSGGGFRAAAFALGVVKYLVEAGLSTRIQAISAVSGGAVAAGMMAEGWPSVTQGDTAANERYEAVVSNFREVVSGTNLRNRSMVRYVGRLRPFGRRHSAHGQTISNHLLQATFLRDLPSELQVVFNTTDLSTGRALRLSQEFIGSWDHGYVETPSDLGLEAVLSACTAVPTAFRPVQLRTRDLQLGNLEEVSLVDGGVYDNLGLEWFQGWKHGRPPAARKCDFLVVVDASGPITPNSRRHGRIRSVLRSQEVQYAQSRMSRIRWLVDQLLAGDLTGVYVPLHLDPGSFRPPSGEADPVISKGSLPTGFAPVLANLRTDLDRFTPEEIDCLTYAGYWAAHVRLRHLFPDLAVDKPRWDQLSRLEGSSADALLERLKAGSRRRIAR